MMWRKAVLFNDAEIAAEALRETSPKLVKALGRRVRNFDKATWDAVARDTVRDGVLLKFEQNERIRQVLLGTGDLVLAEAAPHDSIWGIGLAADVALQTPREQWGTNWLGQVLMEVRAILRQRAAAAAASTDSSAAPAVVAGDNAEAASGTQERVADV
jgi:ribA/ribD-fused uncharacterized protein